MEFQGFKGIYLDFLKFLFDLAINNDISHEYFSTGTNIFFFHPVTLTLEFDLFFENFILVDNFWTVRSTALIFYMSNPWDKTFP